MQRFDGANAAFAGFGVIARNPLAPAVWGLLLLLGALPAFLAFPIILGALPEFIKHGGAEPDLNQMMALQAKMMALQPLSFIASLASRTLVTAAIFRAVLDPQASRFFFLRGGMAELMLLVTSFILAMLAGILMMFGMVFAVIVGVILYQTSHTAAILSAVIIGLLLAGGGIWIFLRLSLSVPMSFAQKEFRLIEGWRLSRDHVGGLFVMALVTYLMIMLVELAVGGVLIGLVVGGAFASGFDPSIFDTASPDLPAVMAAVAPLLPWLIAAIVIGCLAAGYLTTLMTAPWAAAYKALAPAEDAPEIFVPPAPSAPPA